MAAGDVVNTAARLQSAAPTDGILVDETTYRATERSIEFRDAEPVDAKGKAAPVAAVRGAPGPCALRRRRQADRPHAARRPRARARSARRGARPCPNASASRSSSRSSASPASARAASSSSSSAAFHAEPDLTTLAPGPLPPVRRGVSYWALAEIVKAQAGILDTDDEARGLSQARARRSRTSSPRSGEARVGRAQPAPARGARARNPSSVPTGAARRSPPGARFFEAMAETRPLVLVFEDLHFADDGLLDFVDYLVDWATGAPLLARRHSAAGAARPAAGLGRRQGERAHALPLVALRHGDGADRPRRCSTRPSCPRIFSRRLLERADGNPLYAEEFARLVAERQATGASCPRPCRGSSPRGSTRWRRRRSRLLQDASVLGKVFWLGAVAHLGERRGVDARGALARSRAERVRATGAARYRLRRDRVRVPAPARPRRRLRPDSACRRGPRSTGWRRAGSRRWDGRRTTRRCSRTTTSPPWSSAGRRA